MSIKFWAVLATTQIALWGSAHASETRIEQLRGTIQGSISQTAASLMSVPIAPSKTGQPVSSNDPQTGPQLGNSAYAFQQGNNNLASVTQVGHGNSSQLYQLGNNNVAIVTQHR
jgi:Curlin associated repeat